MVFNSFQFVWLFPVILIVYYFVVWISQNRKTEISKYLLVAISYGLYMQWEPKYALVLLWVTAITYFGAILIERKNAYGCKRYLIITGVFLAFIPLLVFKYTNFVLGSFASLSSSETIEVNIIAPLGISFFTFQAVGYLIDVYYKRTSVEHNWWNYVLFVCFFPQILSGPISKASELLPQIKRERAFKYEQSVQGLKWLLWGMFMKTVFADRLGIYVDTIYNNYEHLSGLSCLIGATLYSFQIYGDFAGYSFMAIGVGQLLGFELVNNFQRPYLAGNITEFWHRWHISLTRWLTQNVYIPMGGRCSTFRQYINIMVTFLVSGFWHGANWTFILWGALHGLIHIIEKILGIDPKGKFSQHKFVRFIKPLRILITFFIVSMVWVFFRMPTIHDSFEFIMKIFCDHTTSIASIPPSKLILILIGLIIVCIKDIMDEYLPRQYTILHNRYTVVRWIGYVGIMYLIMMCGVFDAGSFIYVNF